MARKKKTKRSMRKDDPSAVGKSKYYLKYKNMRKGLFTFNSPFYPSNHIAGSVGALHVSSHSVGMNNGVIDKMIIKNRGEHHNGTLPSTKFEDSNTRKTY